MRPHLGAGGDKQFHLCHGADHCTYIAPVQHGASFGPRELLLKRHQRCAHFWQRRDFRCCLPNFRRAQTCPLEIMRCQSLRSRHRVHSINHLTRRRPVQKAGIQVGKAKMRRYAARNRALARCRWSVNCHRKDHLSILVQAALFPQLVVQVKQTANHMCTVSPPKLWTILIAEMMVQDAPARWRSGLV